MSIRRLNGSMDFEDRDLLATEEPLEIRVEGHSVAVVMRTPGEDRELAAGFLVTESLIKDFSDLVDIRHQEHCAALGRPAMDRTDPASLDSGKLTPGNLNSLPKPAESDHTGPDHAGAPAEPKSNSALGNIINVRLKNPDALDLKKLTRHVFTSSSCGICSKSSIAAVRQQFPPIDDACEVDPQLLMRLPQLLSAAQDTFNQTGGLHACALFDLSGRLLVIREDVGRHNALDKVVGWALLENRLPLREHILLLSGRTSFEMLQKSLAAGVPIVAAVSAPSSLAAEFARDSGQTLIGFLRGEKMNIYAGATRVGKPTTIPSVGS